MTSNPRRENMSKKLKWTKTSLGGGRAIYDSGPWRIRLINDWRDCQLMLRIRDQYFGWLFMVSLKTAKAFAAKASAAIKGAE